MFSLLSNHQFKNKISFINLAKNNKAKSFILQIYIPVYNETLIHFWRR